jgi:colicin import membrane protein
MTALLQHIEDLDVNAWAALTLQAAADSVAAAERRGQKPPAELAAIAAMTERELVQRRNRSGPEREQLSPLMQLVQADHLRRVAEERARDAHQDKLDADTAASVARAEAGESAHAATTAREQARTAHAEAARKEVQRGAERTAHQQAMQQLRGEFEQARADAAAQISPGLEQVGAAEARAEQRTTERTAERAVHEQALQQLRGELEQVRADAAAEVAAARGWATGEAAAVRDAAEAEMARAHAAADDAIRQAQAAEARAASPQLLSIPVPPWEIRGETLHIENALNALQQIDHVLEVGMADDIDYHIPFDVDLIHSLVRIVQEHAMHLSNESRELPLSSTSQPLVDAGATYAEAAAGAFRAFLERIETVAQWRRSPDRSPDAEIVEAVAAMLADPWVQDVRSLGR